jgi:hypothetical protein
VRVREHLGALREAAHADGDGVAIPLLAQPAAPQPRGELARSIAAG